MKLIQLLFAFSFLFFLGCSVQNYAVQSLSHRGEILKKYSIDKETFVLLQEGNYINKYRIYSKSKIYAAGLSTTKLYSIDTLTQECYSGVGGPQLIRIDCEKLKKDQDLKEYMKW